MPMPAGPSALATPHALKLTSVGPPKQSWVKMTQVRTLSAERIQRRVGRLTPDELAQVVDRLFEIIGD
jgi:mRNA interferase MazF